MWTTFWCMRSGGYPKELWTTIYIAAPAAEAVAIFCNSFGHHPRRLTCPCCGADYRITSYATLREATAAHRGGCFQEGRRNGHTLGPGGGHYVEELESTSGLRPYQTLPAYLKRKNMLVIRASALTSIHSKHSIRMPGYVWGDGVSFLDTIAARSTTALPSL